MSQTEKLFTKQLMVQLTEPELLQYGHDLADLHDLEHTLEVEKKAANDTFKEKASSIAARRSVLSTAIRDRQERRPVDCTFQYNWNSFARATIRTDTGEEIKVEIIPDDERQLHIEELEQQAAGNPEPSEAEEREWAKESKAMNEAEEREAARDK